MLELLLALLLQLLLLFLLRQVMSDHTPGGGAGDGMMSGDVPSHSTNNGALDTTFRRRGLRADEQCDTQQ